VVDDHAPLVTDDVPVELVVILEPVHRTLDAVHDLVGVLALDGRVGIADLHLEVSDAPVAELRRLVLVRSALAPRHRDDVDLVDPVGVLLRCVVEAHRDVTEDPVAIDGDVTEVVVDRLGDQEITRLLDRDLDLVVADPLERACARGACCADAHDAGDDEAREQETNGPHGARR
jgi:hypothetical protein